MGCLMAVSNTLGHRTSHDSRLPRKKEKGLHEGSRCGLGEETERSDAKKVKALSCLPADIPAQTIRDCWAGWMVPGARGAPSPGQGA